MPHFETPSFFVLNYPLITSMLRKEVKINKRKWLKNLQKMQEKCIFASHLAKRPRVDPSRKDG